MTDDEDIYSDLTSINYFEVAPPKKSEENTNLKELLEERERELLEIKERNVALEKEKKTLEENISSLYKTAVNELKKKEAVIDELTRQKDSILFRRERKQFNDVRPTNVSIDTKTKISNKKDVFKKVNEVIKDQDSGQTCEEEKSLYGANSEINAPKHVLKYDANDRLSLRCSGSKHSRDSKDKISKSNLTERKSEDSKDKISKSNLSERKSYSRSSEINSEERHSHVIPHTKKSVNGSSGTSGTSRRRSPYSKYGPPRSHRDAVRKEEQLNDYSRHHSYRDDRRRPRYNEQNHRERHHTRTERSPSPKRFKRSSNIPSKEYSDTKRSGSSEKYKVKCSDSIRLAARVKSKYSKADRERSISRSISRTPVKRKIDTKSANQSISDTKILKDIPKLHLSELKADSHLACEKTKGGGKTRPKSSIDSPDSNNYLLHPDALESIHDRLKDQVPDSEKIDLEFSKDNNFGKSQDDEAEHKSCTLPNTSPFKLQKDLCVFEPSLIKDIPANHEKSVHSKIVKNSFPSNIQLATCKPENKNYSPPPSPLCSSQNSCASKLVDSKESYAISRKSQQLVQTVLNTPSSTQSESSENESSSPSYMLQKDLCISKTSVSKTSVRTSHQNLSINSTTIVSTKSPVIIDEKENKNTPSPLTDPLQFKEDLGVLKIADTKGSSRNREKTYQSGRVRCNVASECQNNSITEETDSGFIENLLCTDVTSKSLQIDMKTESVDKSQLLQILPQEVITCDVTDKSELITASKKPSRSGSLSKMNVKSVQNVESKVLPNVSESGKTDAVVSKNKTLKVSRIRNRFNTKSPSNSPVDSSTSNLLVVKSNRNDSHDTIETISTSLIPQESEMKNHESFAKSLIVTAEVETVQKQIKLSPKKGEILESEPESSILYNLLNKSTVNSANHTKPPPSFQDSTIITTPTNKSSTSTQIFPTFQDGATVKEHKFSYSVSNEQCEFERPKRKRSVRLSGGQESQSKSPVTENDNVKNLKKLRNDIEKMSNSNSNVNLISNSTVSSIPSKNCLNDTQKFFNESPGESGNERSFSEGSRGMNYQGSDKHITSSPDLLEKVIEKQASVCEGYAQIQSENKSYISSHTSPTHSLFSSQKTCQGSEVSNIDENNDTNKKNDIDLLNTSKKITKEKNKRKSISHTPKKITKTYMNVGVDALKITANLLDKSKESDLSFDLPKAKQNQLFDSMKNEKNTPSTDCNLACSVENNLLSGSQINNEVSPLNIKSTIHSKILGQKILMKNSPNKKKNLDAICDELKANLEKKNKKLAESSGKQGVDFQNEFIRNESVISLNNTSETINNKESLTKESPVEKSNAAINLSLSCNNTKAIRSEKVEQTPSTIPKIVVSKFRRRLGELEDSASSVHSEKEGIGSKGVPTYKYTSSMNISETNLLKQSSVEKNVENANNGVTCEGDKNKPGQSKKKLQNPSRVPRIVVSKFRRRVGHLEDSPSPVLTNIETFDKKSVHTHNSTFRKTVCETNLLKQSSAEKINKVTSRNLTCDINKTSADEIRKSVQKASKSVVSKLKKRVGNLKDSPTPVHTEIVVIDNESVPTCKNTSRKTICETNLLKESSAKKTDEDTNKVVSGESDKNRTEEREKVLQKPTAPRIVVSKFRRRVGNLEDSPTHVFSKIKSNTNQS